jgi:hypothetical protein
MKTRVDYKYVGNGGTWTGTLAEYDDGVDPKLPDAGDEFRLPMEYSSLLWLTALSL